MTCDSRAQELELMRGAASTIPTKANYRMKGPSAPAFFKNCACDPSSNNTVSLSAKNMDSFQKQTIRCWCKILDYK